MSASPPPVDVDRARRSQILLWLGVVAALGLLLSLYSAGFFLYAAAVTAAVLGIGAFLPAASLLGLEVRRSLGAETVEIGGTVESRLVLHNHKTLPALWVYWRDAIEPGLAADGVTCGFRTLASEETVHTACVLHGVRRGLYRVGPAVIETSDPLGLVRRFRVDPEVRFLTVLPRTVDISPGWPLGHRPIHEVPRRRSLFEDPSRFLGVRDYQPGDGLRRIHWRATARSGRLQVKLYEPAVLEGVILAVEMGKAAFPSAPPPDTVEDPGVELAVTAAASIAELVLAHGQDVGLISNGGDAADRYPSDWTGGSFRRMEDVVQETEARRRMPAFRPVEVEPGRGRWQLDRLRSALARLTLAPGLTLAELLVSEAPRLPRSHVILVVTPDLGPALGGALGTLRRSGFDVGVVWIQKGGVGPVATSLLEGVPIYPVLEESDLQQLGAQSL